MCPFSKNLGIPDVDAASIQYLKSVRPGKIIDGYAKSYELFDYGPIEFTLTSDFVDWKGNRPVGFSFAGCMAAFLSDTFWNVRIVAGLENGKLPGTWTKLIGRDIEKAWHLPAQLVHSDVLPAVSPGDELYVRCVCYPEEATYSEPARKSGNSGIVQQSGNEILPLAPIIATFRDAPAEAIDEQKIFFSSEIQAVREFRGPASLFPDACPSVCVTVQTQTGPLSVVHSLAGLSERQRSLIQPGNRLDVRGWLVADVAVGEYANGARYDLASDLRVLAECITRRSPGRSRSVFADNCEYYSRDGLRGIGPEAIVADLERTCHKMAQEDYRVDVGYGRLVIAAGIDAPDLENGQPCLVFSASDSQIHSVMFVATDAAGKIARMETRYDFEEGFSVFRGDDWHTLTASLADLMNANSPRSHDQEIPELSFFDSPEAKARIHGDAGSFSGEPFFSFGDVWEIVDPEIEADLDEFVQASVPVAHFKTIAAEESDAACLDYPDAGPVRCRIIVTKEKDGNDLAAVYPVLSGLPAKIEVMARYDWENGVCGFVSACFEEGRTCDFFVPSYGFNHDKFKPGRILEASISGVAISLVKPETDSLKIESGPMYEMGLASFLQDNPGMTGADYEGITVNLGDSVVRIPTSDTCFYELSAKIVRITEVEFAGRQLCQITLPVARLDTKDVLMNLYAARDDCRGFATGDLINCVVWLCADIV